MSGGQQLAFTRNFAPIRTLEPTPEPNSNHMESDSEFSFVSDTEMTPPRNAKVATTNAVVRNPRVLDLHHTDDDDDARNEEAEDYDVMTASYNSLTSFPEERSIDASPLMPTSLAVTASASSSNSTTAMLNSVLVSTSDGRLTVVKYPKMQPVADHRGRKPAGMSLLQQQRKWLGRRKQRRFENDQFIGVAPHSAPYDLPSFPTSPSRLAHQLLHQSHSLSLSAPPVETLFKTFQKLQPSMVEVFAAGEAAPLEISDDNDNDKLAAHSRPQPHHHRVSRKVRKILKRANRDFVEAMENVLRTVFSPSRREGGGDGGGLDTSLARFCVRPPVVLSEAPLAIGLHLKSPFYRLLAHGVAQFHGLISNSFEDGKGSRVTRISISSRRRAREAENAGVEAVADLLSGVSLVAVM